MKGDDVQNIKKITVFRHNKNLRFLDGVLNTHVDGLLWREDVWAPCYCGNPVWFPWLFEQRWGVAGLSSPYSPLLFLCSVTEEIKTSETLVQAG